MLPCTVSYQGDGECLATSLEPAGREGLEMMLRKLEKVDLDSVKRVSETKVGSIEERQSKE